MKLVAHQDRVAHMQATFVESDNGRDVWTKTFVDPATGERWRKVFLDPEYHGGMPILVREPMPTIDELLRIAARSSDPAEIAASAWLLADTHQDGSYKERLVEIAEEAARHEDQARAALLVGWGLLNEEMNLRAPLGKHIDEVTRDHDHFKSIAGRARKLLWLKNTDPLLRDPMVFGISRIKYD